MRNDSRAWGLVGRGLMGPLVPALMLLRVPVLHAQPSARVTVTVSTSGTSQVGEQRLQVCIGTSANRRLYAVQFADASGTARFDNVPANAAVLITAVKYGFTSNELAYTPHGGSNNQAALTLVAGTGGPTCWGPLVATTLEASHTVQQAPAGQLVTQPPSINVNDQYQNQMTGVTVKFTVTSGGGTVTPTNTTMVTSSTGRAELTSWRLGTVPGVNTVTATVENLPPVIFTATGLASPASVTPVMASTSTYAALAGMPLGYAPPMTVVVRDQNGNPLAGVNVAFAVTSGGGSITSPAISGSDGTARPITWVLGPTAGLNTATASVSSSVPPATIKVYGALEAKSLLAASVVTQQALAGSRVATLPAVLVKDQLNNPMQGASVRFAMASGEGSVSPTTPVLTGTDGIARATSWIVGTKGPSVVSASVTRLPSVNFTATVSDAYTLVAYVKGADGSPIPSAKVCVGAGRDLGLYGVKSADTNGRAVFPLPPVSQYSVTAASTGYAGKTVLFSATGTSGSITIRLATGLIGATCPVTP
jgi:hypothetical protein